MHSFEIYRYDPDRQDAPRMQVFELEVKPGDRMLLDVLIRLKAIDPSLGFRRSCREGICGSDAMNLGSCEQAGRNAARHKHFGALARLVTEVTVRVFWVAPVHRKNILEIQHAPLAWAEEACVVA